MRLFVALELPEDVRSTLASMSYGVSGARWVLPENMHLTLRFIGPVDGAVFDDIAETLDRVRADPFDLVVKGVGHFESGRKPRALWAGVEPVQPVVRLHGSINSALVRAGLPPEGRKYVPHVTLARFKEPPGLRLPAFLQEHSLFQSRPFTVSGFTLFSSFLSRNGPIYTPEMEYAFDRQPCEETEQDDWSSYDPWNVGAGG